MKKGLVLCVVLVMMGAAGRAVDFDTRACVTPRSEIFVSGMQRFVYMKDSGTNRIDKTKYTPTAVALGYEWKTGNWAVGVSASYEWGDVKHYDSNDYAADLYAKLRDRTYGFTLFGKYVSDDGYYMKGSAFLGFARQKMRDGHLGGAQFGENGKRTSRRWGASVEIGKVFENCLGFIVTPHAGFDYAYVPGKSIPFTVGGVAGDIESRSQNFYEIPVGVTFAKKFDVGCDWILMPSVDLTFVPSVGHMKAYSRNSRPGFASRTGSEWKVYGIGAGHWGGRVTAGLKAVKSERFDVDVNYAFEGRKKYHDHRISATLGFMF